MDNDTASHIHQIGSWLLDQWEFVGSVLVVMSVSSMWSLKQVFATRKEMTSCKEGLLESLEAHEEREEKRTDKLEEKIDKLIDHLIKDD